MTYNFVAILTLFSHCSLFSLISYAGTTTSSIFQKYTTPKTVYYVCLSYLLETSRVYWNRHRRIPKTQNVTTNGWDYSFLPIFFFCCKTKIGFAVASKNSQLTSQKLNAISVENLSNSKIPRLSKKRMKDHQISVYFYFPVKKLFAHLRSRENRIWQLFLAASALQTRQNLFVKELHRSKWWFVFWF